MKSYLLYSKAFLVFFLSGVCFAQTYYESEECKIKNDEANSAEWVGIFHPNTLFESGCLKAAYVSFKYLESQRLNKSNPLEGYSRLSCKTAPSGPIRIIEISPKLIPCSKAEYELFSKLKRYKLSIDVDTATVLEDILEFERKEINWKLK